MGGCTSDFYNTLKKEHGETFQKYIVGYESLLEFKKVLRKKEQQYDTKVQNKRQFFHHQVKLRQSIMAGNFNQVKRNLDAQLPGGVASYQQMRKDSVQNLIGYDQYTKRFAGVHQQIDRQVDQRREKTHQQFKEIVKKADQQYTIDPEKMKLYHQMPQQRRAMVHEKGVKQFGEHIRQRVSQLQKRNAQQLDLNLQLQRYNNVVSLEHVDHLVSVSKNKFRAEAINIAGGSFDSNIRI